MTRSDRTRAPVVHPHKAEPTKAEQMHRARVSLMRARHVLPLSGACGLEIAWYRRAYRKRIADTAKEVRALVHKQFNPEPSP